MDEVAEVSDQLMERYLEGEEISHEETVSALKTGVTEGRIFPVTCGAATRNLGINRLLDAFVEDLPSPAKKGAGRDRRHRARARRVEGLVAFVFKTLADPFAGRLNLFRVYQGVLGHDSQVQNCRAHVEGAHRAAARAPGQGHRARRRVRPRRHRRGGQAEGDPRRRRAVLEGHRDPALHAGDAHAGHGVRHRGEGEGRRGEDGSGAPPPAGGGPDDRLPPRHADGGADRGGAHPDPRRGDRGPHARALRRRGGAAPAARALPRDDQAQRQGARPLQEADGRPRPVRRLPHRDRAARPRAGPRLRERDQGRRDPGRVHPRGGEGRGRGDAERRGRGLSRSRASA